MMRSLAHLIQSAIIYGTGKHCKLPLGRVHDFPNSVTLWKSRTECRHHLLVGASIMLLMLGVLTGAILTLRKVRLSTI